MVVNAVLFVTSSQTSTSRWWKEQPTDLPCKPEECFMMTTTSNRDKGDGRRVQFQPRRSTLWPRCFTKRRKASLKRTSLWIELVWMVDKCASLAHSPSISSDSWADILAQVMKFTNEEINKVFEHK